MALALLQAGAASSGLTTAQACTALQVYLASAPCAQAYVQVCLLGADAEQLINKS